LRRRQPRFWTGIPGVQQPVGARFIELVRPVPEGLAVHPANPGRVGPAHPVHNRRKRQQAATLIGVLRVSRQPSQFGPGTYTG
jgi:hypothetical protein